MVDPTYTRKTRREREPLNMIDNRSERWKAAEARISAGLRNGRQPDPADLAIVDEEQAAYDGIAEAEMEAYVQGCEEAERAPEATNGR